MKTGHFPATGAARTASKRLPIEFGKQRGPPTEAASRLSAYFFRQLALEQFLMSMASDFPALEQVPTGHDTLVHVPPEQLPLPSIRPAEASVVKIGVGIDKLRIANAMEANTAIIHFIDHPP